jgi:hypothetical protein
MTAYRHREETLNTQLAILRPSGEVWLVPQSLPDHTNFTYINFIVERGMLGVGRAPAT